MLHLTSGPALVVELGLALFCFVDCLISDEGAVRWIPRWGWVLFVLAFPVCGTIGWLVAGRPWRRRLRGAAGATASTSNSTGGQGAADGHPADRPPAMIDLDRLAADDGLPLAGGDVRAGRLSPDAALAEELLAVHEEHERTLRAWEADLRRREAVLRKGQGQQPAA
jgi:hypothetical protein